MEINLVFLKGKRTLKLHAISVQGQFGAFL